MVAPAGATPCPASTLGAPPATLKISGTSPPGPHRCGSTTCSTKPAAAAASKALPPSSRIAIPAAEASQWVDATMPWVPINSGLVVNTIGSLRPLLPAGRGYSLPTVEQRRLGRSGLVVSVVGLG